MQGDWDCEILTTCARDASTWRDAYAPGTTHIAGVPARRFAIRDERDPRAFDALSARVARGGSTTAELEAWMRAQGPDCPDLTEYLAQFGTAYEAIFFYSYLYATTYFGAAAVAERAVLVPLAHDEWMLDLPIHERTFLGSARVACVSVDERRLVTRRYPQARVCDAIVAPAIHVPTVDPVAFRARYAIDGPYVVYVGRVEPAKNVDELIAFFLAAAKRDRTIPPRKLVLVGPIGMPLANHDAIVPLGALPETEKWNALAGADFAVVPSAYESLSLAALEAWAVGKSVLANGSSSVLVGQCRRANAGLWYANEREFITLLESDLLGTAEELGRCGARYVKREHSAPIARAAMLACRPPTKE